MMKILVACILCLFSCSNKKGAVVNYPSRTLSLGNIEVNKSYTDRIVIRNIGDDVLKIVNLKTDCYCTSSKISKNSILPGDSAYLSVVMKPSIDGYVQQNIYMESNAKNESTTMFTVRAKVKATRQ